MIIECTIKVHRSIGPGSLESAYEEYLCYELSKTDLKVEKQKSLPLIDEEVKSDCSYRSDLLIEEKVVVEVKAVKSLENTHVA